MKCFEVKTYNYQSQVSHLYSLRCHFKQFMWDIHLFLSSSICTHLKWGIQHDQTDRQYNVQLFSPEKRSLDSEFVCCYSSFIMLVLSS